MKRNFKRIKNGTEKEALLKSKFIKQLLYKTKYKWTSIKDFRVFEKQYFGYYLYYGFVNVEKPSETTKTIYSRKSIARIFNENNFRFSEKEVSEFPVPQQTNTGLQIWKNEVGLVKKKRSGISKCRGENAFRLWTQSRIFRCGYC